MKHLLTLSYLGTAYSGFQVQPNAKTVQAALQYAATKIFDAPAALPAAAERTAAFTPTNTSPSLRSTVPQAYPRAPLRAP